MIAELLESLKISGIYTIKLLAIILPTIFIINFLINLGILSNISKLLSPLLKRVNINQVSTYSFLTCFLSPTVGYTILATGYKEGKVNEIEVIGSSLLNSFPSVFSHLLTFFIPVVIPILGFVGVIFILIRLLTSIIKSLIGFIILYKFSSSENKDFKLEKIDKKKNLRDSLKKTLKFGKRLGIIMFSMITLVTFLSKVGFFNTFANLVKPITNLLNLSPNVAILALTETLNVNAAIVMAGEFLRNNLLTPKEIIIGLIIGNIVSFSSKYIRHSLPLQTSLFGLRLGTKIVIINALITLFLDIIYIVILLKFF